MQLVHVAVAVIMRGNQVLIARRADDAHQGGLWEFPGGKVEGNETVQCALKRELKEELDITVDLGGGIQPLIRIRHDYGDKAVLLDVWAVSRFKGEAIGAEGQPIKWVDKGALNNFAFPEANKPIISAILLPNKYMVTGDYETADDCLRRLKNAILYHGITWVQFRSHAQYTRDRVAYIELANRMRDMCRESSVSLILNAPPSILDEVDAEGLHLTFSEAEGYSARPVPTNKWLGVSCHNAEELLSVSRLSPDYVLLSPVKATATHPEVRPLGWGQFKTLIEAVPFPVFALGGMGVLDIEDAIANGAQGIAAISAWW